MADGIAWIGLTALALLIGGLARYTAGRVAVSALVTISGAIGVGYFSATVSLVTEMHGIALKAGAIEVADAVWQKRPSFWPGLLYGNMLILGIFATLAFSKMLDDDGE